MTGKIIGKRVSLKGTETEEGRETKRLLGSVVLRETRGKCGVWMDGKIGKGRLIRVTFVEKENGEKKEE